MTNHSTKTTTQATSISKLVEQLATADTNHLQQAIDTLMSNLHNRADADCIYIAWQVEDVQQQKPDFSIEQCRKVLDRLDRNHDANVGISWDVIDIVADIVEDEADIDAG